MILAATDELRATGPVSTVTAETRLVSRTIADDSVSRYGGAATGCDEGCDAVIANSIIYNCVRRHLAYLAHPTTATSRSHP